MCGVCVVCRSLVDLNDVFQSFVHSGQELVRPRAIHPKPADTAYYDLTKQNEFLVKYVFDGKGNYVYYRDCIRAAFGVRIETNSPTELVKKQEIFSRTRFVLPRNCEQPARMWLDSQPEDVPVQCKKYPGRHRNARKKSNHAKSDDGMERFLLFVDRNSASNGRKEGSAGKTFYFDRKVTQIRTPDKRHSQFEYKCKHSVLFEFNRTLMEDGLEPISVGTFHN